jgi:hypothetical protein
VKQIARRNSHFQAGSVYLISMRRAGFLLLTIFVFSMNAHSQTPEDLARYWEKHHISSVLPSDVRHADLKKYLDKLAGLGVKVAEVGRSNAGREIYQMEFGQGPTKVFMWSQMHGDEPTATSALIDLFAFLQQNQEIAFIKQIAEKLTIRAVPMLNPDGADLYQRRNLQGIDINRDAIDLKTPEARLLKKLRDDWNPAIGFNLHNQGALTTVGRGPEQAAVSLLVVYGDQAKTPSFGHERNLRIASAMTVALQKFIPRNIARYSDEWTPTAFGDNFSAWGTPVILVETGALYGKDEMFLVKMNFVALLTALNVLASGTEAGQATTPYLSLPENGSGGLVNFVFRRCNVVTLDRLTTPPGVIISALDIGAVTERRRASFAAPVVVRSIGELGSLRGLEEYDASGFNVVPRFGTLRVGELAELLFYKKDRNVNWAAETLEKDFEPDAVFSGGKWVKGEGVVPRK